MVARVENRSPASPGGRDEMSKPRKQCKKCPWKKDVDPNDIPNGYSCDLHAKLENTIAKDPMEGLRGGALHIMACHESPIGKEKPCVGWLVHQLGDGNNIGLRLAVRSGRVDANVETVGEQHATFEDTLPQEQEEEEE